MNTTTQMPDKYAGLTLDEKYDLLTKDFLERDGDSFVRIRQSGRLGWEQTLPEGSAYSAAFLNPSSQEELYTRATGLARQMLTAMNTPFRVNVRINPFRNCTDSRSVYVATKVFDDERLTLGERLDTFIGETVHEGCHLLYTDFKSNMDNRNKIIHGLSNVFEDERIERLLGEEQPGLANFLKACKYYYFGKYSQAYDASKLDYGPRLFNAILAIVRFPASLQPEEARTFADELLHVRDILTPYPDSTEATYDCAKKVYELLKKYIQQPPKSAPSKKDSDPGDPQERQQGTGSSGSSDEPSDSEEKDDSKSGKPSSDNNGKPKDAEEQESESESNEDENSDNGSDDKDSDESQDSGKEKSKGSDKQESSDRSEESDDAGNGGDDKDSDEDTEDNASGTSGENEDKSDDEPDETDGNSQNESGESDDKEDEEGDGEPSKPLSDQDIEDILEKVIDALEELTSDPSKPGQDNPLKDKFESKVSDAIRQDPTIAMQCEGELERGTVEGLYLIPKHGSKDEYNASLARVKRWIPVVAAALRSNGTEYRYSITGCRTGMLDTNKLAEARQGVQTVYTRVGEVKCDKVNLVLIIDESGSMGGGRDILARDTAVLINEAVGNLHYTDVFIYGYTSDSHGSVVFPYREGRRPFDKHDISSITAIGGTPTAEAIRECAARVRKQNKEKTIMLVISDGMAMGGSRRVRQAVNKVQQDKMSVIGISVDSHLPPSELKAMYDQWVDMSDIRDLAREIGKTVKKTILTNAKRKSA